jgi:hypothetical protein
MTLPPGLDTLTEADIEAMIFKAEDYERLDRVPMRAGTPAQSASANGRKRRYRQRQRNGKIVLTVEANGFRLIQILIEARYVTEAQSVDRRAIEAAVSRVLADWIRHWQEHNS